MRRSLTPEQCALAGSFIHISLVYLISCRVLFSPILWRLLAALLATLLGRRSSSVVGGGGSVGGGSVGGGFFGLGLLGHG